MPDILSIYRQYGVHYQTEGDRHTRDGWANCACPFCFGKSGLHLGVNLKSLYWVCWRCGGHRAVETLSKLCRVDQSTATDLWRSIAPLGNSMKRDDAVQKRISIHGYKRPNGVIDLLPQHRRYLEGRGFDPDELASTWGVRATGPASYLDHIDYSHRIFIPIEWDGREVSFQTRDFTNKSDLKYKACPMERETQHHKHILYGHPRCFQRRVGIAVEGVTDVWRLGDYAFAVFGISYKEEQVTEIARRFDTVAIVFDGGETTAQRRMRTLRDQLRAGGLESKYIWIPAGDPGSMSQDDASHLVRDIKKWSEGHF